MMGHALAGSTLVSLLVAAPVAFAQGVTSGANGSVTVSVPAGAPAGQAITVLQNTPVQLQNGAPPATVSVSLPFGVVAGAVVSVTPTQGGNLRVHIQTSAGKAIRGTRVSVVVNGQTYTGTTDEKGDLDLVLGATLAAPALPVINVAIPAAPVTSNIVTTSPISAGAIGGTSLAVPAGLPRTGQGHEGTTTMPLMLIGLGVAAGLAGVSFRRTSRKTS